MESRKGMAVREKFMVFQNYNHKRKLGFQLGSSSGKKIIF